MELISFIFVSFTHTQRKDIRIRKRNTSVQPWLLPRQLPLEWGWWSMMITATAMEVSTCIWFLLWTIQLNNRDNESPLDKSKSIHLNHFDAKATSNVFVTLIYSSSWRLIPPKPTTIDAHFNVTAIRQKSAPIFPCRPSSLLFILTSTFILAP